MQVVSCDRPFGKRQRSHLRAVRRPDRRSRRAPLADSFGAGAREEDEELGEARSHKRGLSPYVFVPWEEAPTSILNKPVEEMDLWIPG